MSIIIIIMIIKNLVYVIIFLDVTDTRSMSSSPQNLINKFSVSARSMSDFRFCSSLTRNLVLLSSQMTNQRRPNFQGYDEHVFDQNLFSSNYRKSQQKTFDQKKLLMKIWVFRQVCPAPASSFVAIFSFLLFLQQVMAITSPTHSFPSEEKLIFNIFRNTRYFFTENIHFYKHLEILATDSMINTSAQDVSTECYIFFTKLFAWKKVIAILYICFYDFKHFLKAFLCRWMIDFQIFCTLFFTPPDPGDGSTPILVWDIAGKQRWFTIWDFSLKMFYLGFFPIRAHMMRSTPAPIKENSMRNG